MYTKLTRELSKTMETTTWLGIMAVSFVALAFLRPRLKGIGEALHAFASEYNSVYQEEDYVVTKQD